MSHAGPRPASRDAGSRRFRVRSRAARAAPCRENACEAACEAATARPARDISMDDARDNHRNIGAHATSAVEAGSRGAKSKTHAGLLASRARSRGAARARGIARENGAFRVASRAGGGGVTHCITPATHLCVRPS